ncbi:myb/SANT-like DNA-binding domain-containing protein 4 isoform X2 [Argopecten irradians]|uniref:myb/SANT-like DNA-binding domain-containing protein 4 isoform X2 n=2 Tax=Argopecten irradians TaxID=31199 RepID=UPI00371E53F3
MPDACRASYPAHRYYSVQVQLDCYYKKKADVWQQITDSINAISPTTRSRDEIKKKWQDMVGETRKRESARMMMQRQTGGGSAPKPLSQMQEQILTVISKASIVGIEGGVESSMEDTQDSNMKSKVAAGSGSSQPCSGRSNALTSPFTPWSQQSTAGECIEGAATPEGVPKDDAIVFKKKRKVTSDDCEIEKAEISTTCLHYKKKTKRPTSLCEDSSQEIILLEKEKVALERERLDVERMRCAIERERLELDKKKFDIEKERLQLLQSLAKRDTLSISPPSLSLSPVIKFI